MSEQRTSRVVEVVLLAALAAVVIVSVLIKAPNSSGIQGGLDAPADSESTALYCTGFTGVHGPAPAKLVFTNTTSSPRSVEMTIATTTKGATFHHFVIPADGIFTVGAANLTGSTSFVGVSAIVQGGGVSATAHGLRAGSKVAPCVSSGQSAWSAAGLSTKANWRAVVTLLNPTARPSTLNLTALTPAGFAAPAIFQGLVVAPHAEVALDLGTQIVNLTNVAPMVTVVRGSIVASAVETWSHPGLGASFVPGWNGPSQSVWFPSVPTNASALTSVALSNPSLSPAHVTVDVTLSPYAIQPFTVDLGAGTVGTLVISPSSRIPAVGPASLRVTSNVPIVATVILNIVHGRGAWLVSPSVPATAQIVDDAFGAGFVGGAVANATSTPVTVDVTTRRLSGGPSSTASFSVPAEGATALTMSQLSSWRGGYSVITSTGDVAVALTDAGQRAGVGIILGSGGR